LDSEIFWAGDGRFCGDFPFVDASAVCTPITTPCVDGYHYERIVCTRCPYNHTTPTNPNGLIFYRDSCFCVAGFEQIAQDECGPCRPGSYSPNINSLCIPSRPGTYTQFIGSSSILNCSQNWISVSSASTFCIPCCTMVHMVQYHVPCVPCTMWGTYSNSENTVCLPGDSAPQQITPNQKKYKVGFFCVDVQNAGLNNDYSFIMQKQDQSRWNLKQVFGSIFPLFSNDVTPFTSSFCNNTFLPSVPIDWDPNIFAMRIKSYLWECVMCPTGKYKTTTGTLYSECVKCTQDECPLFESECTSDRKIIVDVTDIDYSRYHQYVDT